MSQLVYHACSARGGPKLVLERGPFCSNPKRKHWLTEGYYFWKHAKTAEGWGESSYKDDTYDYAIIKAKLDFADNELLDLVSEPEQMDYFRRLLSQYMNHMRERLGGRFNPKVSDCIQYFRELANHNKHVFPFIAIMVAEEPRFSSNIQFVENYENKLALNYRIQICLFKGSEDKIKDKELIYPKLVE